MPVQIGRKENDFTNPTGLMSDCHRRIEMFLNVLKTASAFQGRELAADERRALEAALRYFREAAPKHNADEEQSLFPRLRALSDQEVRAAVASMDRLEQEHRWAAPLHAEVDRLAQKWLLEGRLPTNLARNFQSAVERLESMYRAHIEYEDRILFPLAAKVLAAEQQLEMAREMANRRNVIHPGALDSSHRGGASVPRGNQRTSSEQTPEEGLSATPASDLLRSEHRQVEAWLDRLLHAVRNSEGHLVREVRQGLSELQSHLQAHFEKEERILYPRLRSELPELLAQLDGEHEYAREVEGNLVELLGAINETPNERQRAELVRFTTELCDVIQHHIVEEEDQFLRLVDSRLSTEEQASLAHQMGAISRPEPR